MQLDLSDDVIDPALAENDIGIRWGEQRPSSLIITRIAESRQIVCAAPAYLERFGTPRSPHELLNHNCLMMSRLGLGSNEWSFLIDGEVVPLKVSGNFVVNGGHGNYEALIAGLGIGRVTDLRVIEDIRAGRLQPILREFEPDDAMAIYADLQERPAGAAEDQAVHRLFPRADERATARHHVLTARAGRPRPADRRSRNSACAQKRVAAMASGVSGVLASSGCPCMPK